MNFYSFKKAMKYKVLVREMQDKYPHFDNKKDENTDNLKLYAPYVKDTNGKEICICHEINLYTYWQGLDYNARTPAIKYLLVGQDWGNPFTSSPKLMERIAKINSGATDILFDDGLIKEYATDVNLVELFKELGYKDITKPCEDLFFTNFCLGYRGGKANGGMTKDIMMNDAKEFKSLCEILEPQKILCLGRFTFECVYEALTGNEYKIKGNYTNFVENHGDISANCGKIKTKIYPLVHCGSYGIMTRPLELQKKDWEKIENYKIQKEILDKLAEIIVKEGLYWDEENDSDGSLQTEIVSKGDELYNLLGFEITYYKDNNYDILYCIDCDTSNDSYGNIDLECVDLLETIGINRKFMAKKILEELDKTVEDNAKPVVNYALTLLLGYDEPDSNQIHVSKKNGELVIFDVFMDISTREYNGIEDEIISVEDFMDNF